MDYNFNEPGETNETDSYVECSQIDSDKLSGESPTDLSIDLQDSAMTDFTPRPDEEVEDYSVGYDFGGINVESLIQGADDIEEEEESMKPLEALNGMEETGGEDTELNGSSDSDSDIKMPKIAKYILAGLFVVFVLLITLKIIKTKSRESKTQSTSATVSATQLSNNNSSNESKVLSRGNMVSTSELYKDYLVVEKQVELVRNNLAFAVVGTTTKESRNVRVELGLDEYNKLVIGQIVEVQFNLIKIDGKIYTCNTEIIGVIAE